MDLRLARQSKRLTQTQLSEFIGIKQSCLSLAENGHLILNQEEKDEIHFVLGGEIDWKRTENQDNDGYDMQMPKEIVGKPKVGMVIRRLKNPDENAGLDQPTLIWSGEKMDTDKYTYEKINDGR